MEDNIYSDDYFEQMLREKADEFKLQPSRRVWRSVYNSMHPSRKWPSVAISVLIIAALVFIGYINTDSDKKAIAENKSSNDNKGNASPGTARNSTSKDLTGNSNSSSTANANGLNVTGSNGTVSLATTNAPNSQNSNYNYSQAGNTNNNRQLSTETAPVGRSSNQQNDVALNAEQNRNTSPFNTNTTAAEYNNEVTNSSAEGNENNSSSNNTPGLIAAAAQITNPAENTNNLQLPAKDNKPLQAVSKNITAANDKVWIENFAFYNKSNRKQWKDRMAYEYYVTPGISYRSLKSNLKYNMASSSAAQQNPSTEYAINQIPSLSGEIGGAMIYSFAKNFRVKAGVQFNYTSYGIKAYETNHPILTTLTLNDLNSGYPYLDSRSTTVANISGGTTLHNKTYQVSLPVGLEVKLAGKEKLQWYAGATIQPTYIIGGKSYLLSSDRKNYVADNSMMRKWSFNTGIETFVSFKTNHGTTLQIGPQVRFQVPSTYSKKYSMTEKLFSAGLKFGVVRSF